MTSCKVFVGNVPFDCTSEEFQGIFKNMPGYVESDLVMRQDNKLSRGFGIITFSNNINTEILFTDGLKFKDRDLRFSIYQEKNKKQPETQTFKLFVRNVPETMKKEELVKVVSKYGRIGQCRITYDPATGKSRGFGIVELYSKDSFDKLLAEKTIKYGDVTLNVYQFKTRSNQTIVNQYKAGFERGRLVGFQEGINSIK